MLAIAENSFEAVAVGTGKALEDIEKLQVYTRKSKRRGSEFMRWIREHKLIAGLLALLFVLVFIFTISMAFGGGNNSLTNLVNSGTNGVSGFLSSLGNGIRKPGSRYFLAW